MITEKHPNFIAARRAFETNNTIYGNTPEAKNSYMKCMAEYGFKTKESKEIWGQFSKP